MQLDFQVLWAKEEEEEDRHGLGAFWTLSLGCDRVGLGHFPRSPGISRNVRQELSQGEVENGFSPSEEPDAAQGGLSLVKPWFDEHPLSLT